MHGKLELEASVSPRKPVKENMYFKERFNLIFSAVETVRKRKGRKKQKQGSEVVTLPHAATNAIRAVKISQD